MTSSTDDRDGNQTTNTDDNNESKQNPVNEQPGEQDNSNPDNFDFNQFINNINHNRTVQHVRQGTIDPRALFAQPPPCLPGDDDSAHEQDDTFIDPHRLPLPLPDEDDSFPPPQYPTAAPNFDSRMPPPQVYGRDEDPSLAQTLFPDLPSTSHQNQQSLQNTQSQAPYCEAPDFLAPPQPQSPPARLFDELPDSTFEDWSLLDFPRSPTFDDVLNNPPEVARSGDDVVVPPENDRGIAVPRQDEGDRQDVGAEHEEREGFQPVHLNQQGEEAVPTTGGRYTSRHGASRHAMQEMQGLRAMQGMKTPARRLPRIRGASRLSQAAQHSRASDMNALNQPPRGDGFNQQRMPLAATMTPVPTGMMPPPPNMQGGMGQSSQPAPPDMSMPPNSWEGPSQPMYPGVGHSMDSPYPPPGPVMTPRMAQLAGYQYQQDLFRPGANYMTATGEAYPQLPLGHPNSIYNRAIRNAQAEEDLARQNMWASRDAAADMANWPALQNNTAPPQKRKSGSAPRASTKRDRDEEYNPGEDVEEVPRKKSKPDPGQICAAAACTRKALYSSIYCYRCDIKYRRAGATAPLIPYVRMDWNQAYAEVYPTYPGLDRGKVTRAEMDRRTQPEKEEHWIERLLEAVNYDVSQLGPEKEDGEAQTLRAFQSGQQKKFNGKIAIEGRPATNSSQKDRYTPEKVSARLRMLYREVVALHNGGRAVYPHGGNNFGYGQLDNANLSFDDRLKSIVETIRLNKICAEDVIEGRGVVAFVQVHDKYLERKLQNFSSNNTKKVALQDVKRAQGRASAAQESPGVDPHSNEEPPAEEPPAKKPTRKRSKPRQSKKRGGGAA